MTEFVRCVYSQVTLRLHLNYYYYHILLTFFLVQQPFLLVRVQWGSVWHRGLQMCFWTVWAITNIFDYNFCSKWIVDLTLTHSLFHNTRKNQVDQPIRTRVALPILGECAQVFETLVHLWKETSMNFVEIIAKYLKFIN